MNILLIQPPSTENTKKEFVSLQYPINLGYIASVLREKGHTVKMLDLNVLDHDHLSRCIKEFKPVIVGLTSMTPSIYYAKNIISEVKKLDNKITTVLGGVHASALPIETMDDIKDLDILVFGEGEKTIVEIAETLEKGKRLNKIDGTLIRTKNRIIKNKPRELIKDLNTIPFPARDLLPFHLYNQRHVSRGFSRKNKKIIEIMTSRGCPNQCIFCAGHINYGNSLRFRSFENIVEEINECIEKYNISHISIEDDTFTINKELVGKLCAFFRRKKLTWNCNARVNTVNFEMLKTMKRSGCKKISFGVESGNPEMLKKIKKGINIPQVINAVRWAKKAGIRYVECTFMIGSHLDETRETVKDTKRLIFKLMPDFISVAIMCPFPGTEIYQMMLNKNLLKKVNWSQFSLYGELARYKKLPYLTSKEMAKLQHSILKEYYGSPKYILSQALQIRTFEEIKYFFNLGTLFLKEMLLKGA